MPQVDLMTLLELVGELTDSADEGSASERFRRYLGTNLRSHTDARSYADAALSHSGDQFNKALQDLVNHVGGLLGFEVEFGRYRGVRNEIGYDGLWRSSSGWTVVVECKTTDVYAVKTATLLGYINALVSDGRITDASKVLGLYVYGRLDSNTSQLENAIIVEGRRDRLRVVSVEALLNLVELMQQYNLRHDRVLDLLLPAPVQVDGVVNMIYGIVAQERESTDSEPSETLNSVVITPQHVLGEGAAESVAELGETSRGRNITAVVLLGHRSSVETWRAALLAVAGTLYQRDAKAFESMIGTLGGRKRTYLARDTGSMRMAAQVPGSKLYIETHFSADSITRLCYRMVEQMGLPPSELEFVAE